MDAKVAGRDFLKDTVRLRTDFHMTAQRRGEPAPPAQKPCHPGVFRVQLSAPGTWQCVHDVSVADAIARRESRRGFSSTPLNLDELSFLLWATQGLRDPAGSPLHRTVPSAGARHAFETYLIALDVTGLSPAVYRYLPKTHELILEFELPQAASLITEAVLDQSFLEEAGAVFIWSVLPERMEWRYSDASYKVLAIDAGHVCQNLYLACECIDAGTCAVAAYHQEKLDRLLRLDGEEEFVIYLAPVGKRHLRR